MPKMIGNFDAELKLQNGGQKVSAAGPLRWRQIPDEVREVRVVAAISQGQTYGSGGDEFKRPPDKDKDGTWCCDVSAEDGKRFQAGPALAAGVVVFLDAADDEPYPWPAQPTLS